MWAPDQAVGLEVVREPVEHPDPTCRTCDGSGLRAVTVAGWTSVGDYGQGFYTEDVVDAPCACVVVEYRLVKRPRPIPATQGCEEVPF
jgi:hypothetical protein